MVDDDDIVLEVTRSALSRNGYHPIVASDGETALRLYREDKRLIDAVLLDLVMPKMSGKTVFEELHKYDPEVKVLVYSGHPEKSAEEFLFEMAKGFIKKPFVINELLDRLRTVLKS